MKSFASIFIVAAIVSCNSRDSQQQKMLATIDSLQKQLNESYKPGLGEFMSSIQVHHAKLWFAGQNQNWPLADFEIHEIQEAVEDIRQFCKDRAEIKSIGMLDSAIDSVNNSIQHKNPQLFKSSFVLLTNTCNSCHRATEHGFNVVTVPTSLPVSNQDFKPVH